LIGRASKAKTNQTFFRRWRLWGWLLRKFNLAVCKGTFKSVDEELFKPKSYSNVYYRIVKS